MDTDDDTDTPSLDRGSDPFELEPGDLLDRPDRRLTPIPYIDREPTSYLTPITGPFPINEVLVMIFLNLLFPG